MIEYIKIAVISLISGFLAPLPFSYAASYSFLSYILEFNKIWCESNLTKDAEDMVKQINVF